MIHAMSERFMTAPTDSGMTPADWEMLMAAAPDPVRGNMPLTHLGWMVPMKYKRCMSDLKYSFLVLCTQKMKKGDYHRLPNMLNVVNILFINILSDVSFFVCFSVAWFYFL